MKQESDSLHARVRAFIAAAMHGDATESFDALSTDIARFQIERVAPVRRLAIARGLAGADLAEASQIPAVPTDVFRFARVAAHPSEEDVAVFRTSGTTSGARGEHSFRTLATYDAAAVAWASRHLLSHPADAAPSSRRGERPGATSASDSAAAPRRTERPGPSMLTDATVISLTPPPDEATDSSLVHMIALFARTQRAPVSFHLDGGALDPRTVAAACARARKRARPAILFGTSFAFVHLIDSAGSFDLSLPEGSRAMLTGGFKGRSREVPADELRAAIAKTFGLPDGSVVGEYGMTELSSQLYERTLVKTATRHDVYAAPPWVRVTAVDPATLEPLPEGEIGIARIVDLANVDSAVVVQTADRVRVTGDEVELFGRLPGATPRGCSLAVEEMLE